MSFTDLFSRDSRAYASFRPRYPAPLFDFIADNVQRREVAWDCATGNGQAAIGLASHFGRVIATDASADQLAAAIPHERVEYRKALAESSGLDAGSVNAVTVAQALHWLDRDRFYAEARRTLAPGGFIAAWCYDVVTVAPDVDDVLRRFYTDTVGPFWLPDRALVESGYRTLVFPFEEIDVPSLWIEESLTLDALGGYVGTWSSTRRYVDRHGVDPVPMLLAELAPLWGPTDEPRPARWPLHVRAGLVRSSRG